MRPARLVSNAFLYTTDLSKKWLLTVKKFEDFRRKKRTETLFLTFQKTSLGQQDPKANN